jgi:hypothetical protein
MGFPFRNVRQFSVSERDPWRETGKLAEPAGQNGPSKLASARNDYEMPTAGRHTELSRPWQSSISKAAALYRKTGESAA